MSSHDGIFNRLVTPSRFASSGTSSSMLGPLSIIASSEEMRMVSTTSLSLTETKRGAGVFATMPCDGEV